MTTRIPLPWEAPPTFCKARGDGKVVLTDAGRALVASGVLDLEPANMFVRELLHATYVADEHAKEARGDNQWLAEPIGDGRFRVRHDGAIAIFRPILNSKRAARSVRAGHRCTVCRAEMPQGATMYVYDRPANKPEKGHEIAASAWKLHGNRVCEKCMRPELSAALVGAAILAGGGQ